jgi:hypothetical protein
MRFFPAAAALAAALALAGQADPAGAGATWKSGTRGSDASSFASWRGTALGVAVGWAPWSSRDALLNYFSSSNPRALRSKNPNVSIAVGLFPRSGGNLADCAAGRYAEQHRATGGRLAANGLGDAELRLGWEPGSPDYPWTAVNRPAAQWNACFANAARAIKGAAPGVRLSWHMNKKGHLDVRTIWPDAVAGLVANVGVSHYDDAQARFGTETADGGSPWGLRAWLAFAQARGKKLEMAEWGVGRRGDRPEYVQRMHDFFHFAGARLAHEGYFNGGNKRLYPTTNLPKSAAKYRELF